VFCRNGLNRPPERVFSPYQDSSKTRHMISLD
jgi:hypothetical protein